MAIAIENGEFRTRNTALAAYLRIEGFKLLDVDPSENNTPAVFYFEQDLKIPVCERLWQLGKAEGNLVDFWESYRLCLRMVKVGKL